MSSCDEEEDAVVEIGIVVAAVADGERRRAADVGEGTKWWAENYDKVMELYNVQRLNRQAFPLPTPPRSEDESLKIESAEESPVTPPLNKERLPRTLYRPIYSSSESLEQQSMNSRYNYDSCSGVASTPKLSSISGAKTEISSIDASASAASMRTSTSRSGELSISNASDLESEWVEQDEAGVYITIRALPDGKRELRRVRFRPLDSCDFAPRLSLGDRSLRHQPRA
nr:protein Brevis radix-like 4 [Ipomoea batatas]